GFPKYWTTEQVIQSLSYWVLIAALLIFALGQLVPIKESKEPLKQRTSMAKSEAKQRIEKLKKVINHHRYLYHVLNKQGISDEALDSLKHELYKLEQQHPEFITPDSPTQRVAGESLKEFRKVAHKVPMLSIEDVFSEKELEDWQEYLKRLAPNRFSQKSGKGVEYFAELKIDGFAISLLYKNGVFEAGSTRGNGITGEDVTQNLKTIESIPLRLELQGGISTRETEENLKNLIKKGEIEIRGEVYMGQKAFERFNKELEKSGKKTFANPRNLAAGSIRQLDHKLVALRPLRFLAYDIVTDIGQEKHSDEHEILKILGFKADQGRLCENLAGIVEFWKEIAKKREGLPFQIDGVVVNVNDNSLFQKLGVVGKSPRGMRAFKFSPKQATTKVLSIQVQIGRTGAVTPVAHLDPIEVGGVTITRATLHNEDEIKRLGVKIGDTVIVGRAGDVIPDVIKVLPELRTGKEKNFVFPKNCPVCNKRLIKPDKEVIWRCPDKNCPARKRENFYHFVSKKAFDIDGLGPKIIDQLMDGNLISQIPDIFELKEGDLFPLERFAEKSAKNLIESIQKSKEISLSRFIFSLGIRHTGEETAVALSSHFNDIVQLKNASKEELRKISDIGEKVSESIYNWFRLKQNQKLIEDLILARVKILPPEKISKKLAGKTFVLTGSMETMTRDTAKEKIRLLGGDISESVSKETDFVVIGKEPGTKLEKAKKIGVKIIDEKEFLQFLK
ncbi:MAG: NAD-dependent DNA ligase LigA, partial [bacterium]|nr:NAD-dependent DNA ligase LigA [bacterium]